MNITLVAVGSIGRGPEHDLFEIYKKRMFWSLSTKEVGVKKRLSGDALKSAEAVAISSALPVGAAIIALDERGQNLTSRAFASRLEQFQVAGCSKIAVIIGGAAGLDDTIRLRADMLLSFGKLTWPHMMVRAMVAEQLYRAQTILSGHPYHRD